MKKIILCCIAIIAVVASVHAQQYPVRVPGYPIFNKEYVIDLEIKSPDEYVYSIYKKDDTETKKALTLIQENNYEEFAYEFQRKYKELLGVRTPRQSLDDSLKTETARIFYYFKGSKVFANDLNYAPVAGTLKIKEKIEIERAIYFEW